MAKVITICNHKGGVAKTTTTLNLGVGLAREDRSVLLIDADSQGNLTSALGWRNGDDTLDKTIANFIPAIIKGIDYSVQDTILHHEEGVDLLPANCELADWEVGLGGVMNRERIISNIVSKVKDSYDYILIDSPPSLGIMSINTISAADSVVIPTTPGDFSVNGLTKMLRTINNIKKYINHSIYVEGVLITRADFRTTLPRETKEVLNDIFGNYVNIFDVIIPEAISANKAVRTGKSIFEFNGNSSVAKTYGELSKQIISREERTIGEIEREVI